MNDIQASTLTLNGVEYVRKDSVNADPTLQMSKTEMSIIRCRNAGVHAGQIVEHDTITGFTKVQNSRRLWKWVSKATLSELAMQGPLKPNDNRYGCVLPIIFLNTEDICEIIPCTEVAAKLIAAVPVWEAQ